MYVLSILLVYLAHPISNSRPLDLRHGIMQFWKAVTRRFDVPHQPQVFDVPCTAICRDMGCAQTYPNPQTLKTRNSAWYKQFTWIIASRSHEWTCPLVSTQYFMLVLLFHDSCNHIRILSGPYQDPIRAMSNPNQNLATGPRTLTGPYYDLLGAILGPYHDLIRYIQDHIRAIKPLNLFDRNKMPNALSIALY